MNVYTQDNPPKRGTARKIWKQFHDMGLTLNELHYNPNNWGRDYAGGWGTWACTIGEVKDVRYTARESEWLCGLEDGRAYVQSLCGSYQRYWLNALIRK